MSISRHHHASNPKVHQDVALDNAGASAGLGVRQPPAAFPSNSAAPDPKRRRTRALQSLAAARSALECGATAPLSHERRASATKRRRPGAPQYISRPPALRAFTLVEIMVVVVILGILAATIIPLFRGTTHDAKVGAAKANIAELESALERFSVHMDRYPSTEEGLRVLVDPPSDAENKWRGPYIKVLRLDPWKAPYQYRMPGLRHTTSFDLWSRGADKSDGGEGEGADIGNGEP